MPRHSLALLCAVAACMPMIAAAQSAGPPAPSQAAPSRPVSETPFSPSQRAAIIEIIRSALISDPSILRDAVLALQQQQNSAAAIAQALRANAQDIYAAGDPIAGNPDGRVTLVEFFDVRCPYCRQMQPVIEQLLRTNRDVKLILKDLPILGPPSVLGSQALLAAQAQGGYLKMQAALMQDGAVVDEASVQGAARSLGLDWPRLRHDMDSPSVAARINRNLALAQKLSIEGTPAMVAGDHLFSGAVSLDDLERTLAILRR